MSFRLMHVGKGRKHPLHVDYIFLGACLGYIQDAMTEAILSHPRIELTQKIAIVKAIGKVIWIQNDLMAKWHLEDGKEFEDDVDEEEVEAEAAEPEGYIHGKRMLGSNGSDDDTSITERASSISSGRSEKSTTSLGRTKDQIRQADEMSKCPFSGMSSGGSVDLTTQRATTATWRPKREEHELPPVPIVPTGIPRLRIVDGKTVCKEKLDPNPFE